MNILLIGYGAIGAYVADHLSDCREARVRWVLCRRGRNENATGALGASIIAVNRLVEIDGQIDLAIECAGHAALADHGAQILERGIDLIAVSNGALAHDGVAESLERAARRGNSQLQLLPGAIGGIDAICASKLGGLSRVVYRGRKPPSGWKGSPAEQITDLDTLKEPVCHFAGSARQAALQYPKNANVAATIALAGMGLDQTQVELIADPDVTANIHEVEVSGSFGKLNFTIEGNPLPGNPRSSALTAMSIVRAVRNRLVPVVI